MTIELCSRQYGGLTFGCGVQPQQMASPSDNAGSALSTGDANRSARPSVAEKEPDR